MINKLNEGVVVVAVAFIERVSSPYYLMTLARLAPKTMSKLCDGVNKQIWVEETL